MAALTTLGCRLNHAETEAIRRSLEEEGFRIVPWGEQAELCVLNSCTVTAKADAKSRQALGAIRRSLPEATLALVGCYAQTQGERLKETGLADLIVGNQQKMELPRLLSAVEAGGGPRVVRPPISRKPFHMAPRFDLDGGTRAHLKIQDGCDFMCAFCIIPAARGRSRPRELDNLLDEARAMGEAGAREVVLTGVNIGTFDHEGKGILDVVDALRDLPGLMRIRISSIEPTTVPDGILERMADPGHPLTPFLHLPLQSASDRILEAMRRRYSIADYREAAQAALQKVPGLCLGTDVMVGFPGEDDRAFGETRDFLADLPFAFFHVFPFSRREGTPAARHENPVAEEKKAARARLLNRMSDEKRSAYHHSFEGRVLPVLFERSNADGMARGLTENYIRVEAPHPEPERLRNEVLPVRLLGDAGRCMRGEFAAAGL